MIRLITTIALTVLCSSLFAQTPADSIALANAEWQSTKLGNKGEVRSAELELFGVPQCISVFSYPAKALTTRIVQADKLTMTSKLAADNQAVAAINGSYFNVKQLVPSTLVKVNGKVLGQTEDRELFRVNGIVALKGRRLIVVECDTRDEKVTQRYRNALGAGPVLIDDGRELEYKSTQGFFARHPRSVIGARANGDIVMIVVDGRFKDHAVGMSIKELTYLSRQLGLVEAINLDGGGSSTLWTSASGIVNHPYDNKRFDHEGERHVTNCIVATE